MTGMLVVLQLPSTQQSGRRPDPWSPRHPWSSGSRACPQAEGRRPWACHQQLTPREARLCVHAQRRPLSLAPGRRGADTGCGGPSVGAVRRLFPCPRPLSACDFWQPERKRAEAIPSNAQHPPPTGTREGKCRRGGVTTVTFLTTWGWGHARTSWNGQASLCCSDKLHVFCSGPGLSEGGFLSN